LLWIFGLFFGIINIYNNNKIHAFGNFRSELYQELRKWFEKATLWIFMSISGIINKNKT